MPNYPGTYRAFSGLDFWGRLSTYFDLTPNWQLETGMSGLWNPKTGAAADQPTDGTTPTEQERRVAGLDLKLSYVPLRNNQFRSLAWGTEVLYSDSRYLFDPGRHRRATANEYYGNVGSLGMYSYVTYKWHRQWSGGFLFDWVQNAAEPQSADLRLFALHHLGPEPLEPTASAIHPHRPQRGRPACHPDDAIYLQWAWIIGSHSHGWQAR